MPRITPDSILGQPPELLALDILEQLPGDGFIRRDSYISDILLGFKARVGQPHVAYGGESLWRERPALTMGLVEAWQRLVLDGLIVNWPPTDPQFTRAGQGEVYTLTSWGRSLKKRDRTQARKLINARRQLAVDLHPRLAERLKTLIAVGAFSEAANWAFRAVEARVRDLLNAPRDGKTRKLTGTPLMQQAFGERGALADPEADPGERQGSMFLFAGAFGAIRNILAHTDEELPDPTEAVEHLLLADLLMRQLDRVETRLKTAQTANSQT